MKSGQKVIIKKLVETLGITPEEAQSLFKEWAIKIKSGLADDGEVSVNKLGKFTKIKGKIYFEPDDQFALEVNYKYAGMQPIEILPAYRLSGDITPEEKRLQQEDEFEQEDDDLDDNIYSIRGGKVNQELDDESAEEVIDVDENVSGPEHSPKDFESTTEEADSEGFNAVNEQQEDDDEGDASVDLEDIFGGDHNTKDKDFNEVDEEYEQENTQHESESIDESSERQRLDAYFSSENIKPVSSDDSEYYDDEPDYSHDDEEEPEEIAASASSKDAKKTTPRASAGQSSWMITGVLTVIIVAAVFLFLFIFDTSDEGNGTGGQVVEDVQESATPGGATEEEEEEEQPETEPAEPEEEQAESETPEEPEENWGVYGQYHDEIDDYYTIVIHSLQNRDRATEYHESLRDQEYRATLNLFSRSGQPDKWRVGIGQFESVDDAVAAAEELPSEFRENHFIIRIR